MGGRKGYGFMLSYGCNVKKDTEEREREKEIIVKAQSKVFTSV